MNEVVPVDELINHIRPSAGKYLCYFLARILLVESSKLWIKTFYLGCRLWIYSNRLTYEKHVDRQAVKATAFVYKPQIKVDKYQELLQFLHRFWL